MTPPNPSLKLSALDVFCPPHAVWLAGKASDLAIVFLHYFGGSQREWWEVVQAFPGRFRCVALDLRGHGDSPDAPTHSVDDMAGDVRHTLQNMGVKRCVLVGHSMGGKIALAIAAALSDTLAVEALLLISPSPPSGQPMTDAERQETNDGWGKRDAMEKMLQNAAQLPIAPTLAEQFIGDNLRVTKSAWDAWQNRGSREDISGRMAGIKAPSLVLSGECDSIIAPDLQARDVVARLTNARQEIVPGAGHLLPFETPQAVVDALEALIAPLPPNRGF